MKDFSEFKEKLIALAEQAIEEVFQKENLRSFLDVVWHCPFFPMEDQLLIWKQCPNATEVAGIRKWKKEGKEIPPKIKPILILMPYLRFVSGTGIPKRTPEGFVATDGFSVSYEVNPEYTYGREVQPVIDISSFSETVKPYTTPDIEESLRRIGITVMEEDACPPGHPDGYALDTVFHVSKNIKKDKERYQETLLRLYIEKEILRIGEEDDPDAPKDAVDLLSLCARYCLSMRFFGDSSINLGLVSIKAKDTLYNKKKSVLGYLSHYVSKIIQDIDGSRLTFEDTAVINGTLKTASKNDYIQAFQWMLPAAAESEESARALEALQIKIFSSKKDFLPGLYETMLQEKVIYSNPPVVIAKEE